jgi:glycosyltransferase involved in cell wall biosynthesis
MEILPRFRGFLAAARRARHDLSYNRFACYARAWVAYLAFRCGSGCRSDHALQYLLLAQQLLVRICRSEASPGALQRLVDRTMSGAFRPSGWGHAAIPRHRGIRGESPQKLRPDDASYMINSGGIVLKAPRYENGRPMEKGVLVLVFATAYRLAQLFIDLELLSEEYTIVLQSGWSSLANIETLYFARLAPKPVIVMATDHADRRFLKQMGTNLIPVAFGFSDWVDPRTFHTIEGERKYYDAVMVARWALYKRHYALFRILRRLDDPSLKVAIVGIKNMNERDELEYLRKYYNVRNQIDIFPFLSQKDVNIILNQSKVNMLLSIQEGSNRTLFEGFFAGVPALGLTNNIGLNRDYFTRQTGKLVPEREFGTALKWFREHWREFDPSTWAHSNIGAERTTAKLNTLLMEFAKLHGEPWTRDIVGKCDRLDFQEHFPDASAGDDLPRFKDVLSKFARSDAIREVISEVDP